jgi:starch synthase (maltosyl-transferring)
MPIGVPSHDLSKPAQLHPRWRAEARIAILDVYPVVDGGRFPVKRIVGDPVEVWADILRDGHDAIAARISYRRADEPAWRHAAMRLYDNDRWVGVFAPDAVGRYLYTIEAWTDRFLSWRSDVGKKHAAGHDVALALLEGQALVAAALERAAGDDRAMLGDLLGTADAGPAEQHLALLLSPELAEAMARWPDRGAAVGLAEPLDLVVDRPAARFAAWYEMFPRSQGRVPGRGADFDDCIRRLPEIAALGFDVVYLVPIHPIGRINRKGRDNALTASPDDPGSPYAIGAAEGGHCAIHPELGTIDDFRRFVREARRLGMEVALDFAVQCAPDHPWIAEHPEWFSFRPDGSIKYAENPPKKYQDIVNVEFYNRDRDGLWQELLGTILFWAGEGVRVFRVDNPHTKPAPFWEWCITAAQQLFPDLIFLSEAFTRPKMMHLLAKAGFTQSYTYFTWRNTKQELTEYLTELTQGPAKEFLRPNFFTNTPDILPRVLQEGGRAAFRFRLVLAATLSPAYGIYNGYELCENAAIPNSEEYLRSEKYEYKVWDWDRPGHIKDEIAALNRFRRENPALGLFTNLVFCPTDDEHVLAYLKATPDRSNIVLVVVNLDPVAAHEALIDLPLHDMGIDPNHGFTLAELFSGAHHRWRGAHHRLRLDPAVQPASVFRIMPSR